MVHALHQQRQLPLHHAHGHGVRRNGPEGLRRDDRKHARIGRAAGRWRGITVMKFRWATLLFVMGAASTVVIFGLATASSRGQTAAYRAPRTGDGKPDLNGIWQAMNTANWDIQDHDQRQGPQSALGAAFSVPPGEGVVVGNEIPYQPAALAKKKENAEQWLKLDPEVKCYLPGIPRATYMPYPFQIVQTPTRVLFAYAYANA